MPTLQYQRFMWRQRKNAQLTSNLSNRWRFRFSVILSRFSHADVQCFPDGSEPKFCDDMDASSVLANCLRRSVGSYISCIWMVSKKCVALFKKSFQGMWTLYVSDMPWTFLASFIRRMFWNHPNLTSYLHFHRRRVFVKHWQADIRLRHKKRFGKPPWKAAESEGKSGRNPIKTRACAT